MVHSNLLNYRELAYKSLVMVEVKLERESKKKLRECAQGIPKDFLKGWGWILGIKKSTKTNDKNRKTSFVTSNFCILSMGPVIWIG